MTGRVKIIGKRRPAAGFEQAAAFLDTVVALRGDQPFIPRGYYRFKTFAEAQAWSIRMMARTGRRTDDRRQIGEEGRRIRSKEASAQHST
ncbi:MAG: hypothetical protein HYV35_01990 [Lentisphaerae bacterium]|nr:hypothetical protein [Lentisphaerota bacterium]